MTGTITVRFFAAAAEAAGRDQAIAEASDAGALRAELADRYGSQFARVLGQCALLSGGGRLDDAAVIEPGATVDVLPPFAGG